jgi:thioredoxin 1
MKKFRNLRINMATFEDVDVTDFDQIMDAEFNKGNIVILKFGTQMCDACHALESELEDLEEESENISVLLIDCNEAQDLAEAYDIQEVPTMIILKSREELIYRNYGVLMSSDIEKIISKI